MTLSSRGTPRDIVVTVEDTALARWGSAREYRLDSSADLRITVKSSTPVLNPEPSPALPQVATIGVTPSPRRSWNHRL